MKRCLDLFCMISGQKVNYQKSMVYFLENTTPDIQQKIIEENGIPSVMDLGKYMGVQSIHGRLERDYFACIIERVQLKLACWKAKTLSLAGI